MEDANLVQSTQPTGDIPVQHVDKRSIVIQLFVAVFLAFIVGGAGYFLATSQSHVQKSTTLPTPPNNLPIQPKSAIASSFATYTEMPVTLKASLASYKVSPDLVNITNKSDVKLSTGASDLLVKNNFVVVPSTNNLEFFPIYESNRYDQFPSFITTDSMLHNYHLMFDHLLKNVEENNLTPTLKNLNKSMLSASIDNYNSLKGTNWENAAKRNIGFFVVASKLLDASASGSTTVVDDLVGQELSLINNHSAIAVSPLMNIGESMDPLVALKEDYTQYIPRGHYDTSDLLKAYFKSMMWYGRLTFRFNMDDEVKSAALITLLLNDSQDQKLWNDIYEPTNFFVGKSDDIGYYQFRDLMNNIYGEGFTLTTLTSDTAKFANLVEQSKKLAPPQINSMPIFNKEINPDREKEIQGFRFMGQRFTLDASIFQQLIYRDVEGNAKGDNRMLPKGLDILAAMGSNEAYNLLKQTGETDYKNYPENMQKMKTYTSGLKVDTWTQNLYWGWLYSLLPLTTPKENGYPSFMTNLAWVRKDLNTYLGSWTELKHDTILYAKQVYAELGGGPPEPKDDRGYVEPEPDIYARLASLLNMTSEGLQARGLLSSENKQSLDRLTTLATSLKTISEKELRNETLTTDEYNLIKDYGGDLEHFWLEAFKDQGVTSQSQLDDKPAAIVADVATDPNGQVLEEGTGFVSEIYAVVPVEGKLRIAKGGVYSYYEFPWPISDRLTDTKWRDLLKTDKAPKLPDWTSIFTASITSPK